jgi:hypothetical protein
VALRDANSQPHPLKGCPYSWVGRRFAASFSYIMELFDAPRTVNFQLEPDPEFAGQVKSSEDRYGRTVNNSGFPMTYAIVHVVHGLWEPAQRTVAGKLEPSRASLIVIRFELARLTSKSSRRFVSFNPKLRFEADPYTEPINDPWVAHFEPAGKGKRYITESESNVTHQKAVEVRASLNAAPAPVTGGATYTHTKSEEFTKIKRYEIGSGGKVSQSRGAGRNGRDEIWWNLTEDEGKGVGDQLQVAVLVKRNNMSNFKIHLTLRAHVDGLHSLTTAFKDAAKKAVAPFHSLNTFAEVFSPTAPNNNIPAGIDSDNLSHIEKDGTLDRLAFEHSAEKMHSAILYPEGTSYLLCILTQMNDTSHASLC